MLPVSEKRLAANRANAARSTGPATPEGKARSSQNALRHGLLSKQLLIRRESAADFQALSDILIRRFAPVDDQELSLIQELASADWRLRRARRVETEMFETAMEKQPGKRQITRMAAAFNELAAGNSLNLLHRYETRLHIIYQQALENLILLRQSRAAGAICENEPKTPIAVNEFGAKISRKPTRNSPELPEIAPHSPSLPVRPGPKEPFTPTPTPSSQIMEPSDIISS